MELSCIRRSLAEWEAGSKQRYFATDCKPITCKLRKLLHMGTASLCDIDFIGALKSLKAVLYGETKSAKIKDEMSN